MRVAHSFGKFQSVGSILTVALLAVSALLGLVLPLPAHAVTQVTVPITLSMGYPDLVTPVPVTLSGCAVDTPVIAANTLEYDVMANPGCTITATLPYSNLNNSNIRVIDSAESNVLSIPTCATGTCPMFTDTLFLQYYVGVSFNIKNDAHYPTLPTFRYNSLGMTNSILISDVPTNLWVDSHYYWSATVIMRGSTTTERWISTNAAGYFDNPGWVHIWYYHQFFVNVVAAPHGTAHVVGHVSKGWFNAGAPVALTTTTAWGYTIRQWSSSTSLITFNNPYSSSTTAIIHRSGTITASFICGSNNLCFANSPPAPFL